MLNGTSYKETVKSMYYHGCFSRFFVGLQMPCDLRDYALQNNWRLIKCNISLYSALVNTYDHMVGIRTDVQNTAQITGPWKHVQISHYTVIKVLSYSSLSV